MAVSPTNSEIECNGANDGTCPKHPEIDLNSSLYTVLNAIEDDS